MTRTAAAMTALCVAVLLSGVPAAEEEQGQPCAWSAEWRKLRSRFPALPADVEIVPPKRKTGRVVRPSSRVGHVVDGHWTVEGVIDEKGRVRDVRILETPRLDPPWPEYEAAVLRAVRKYRYVPARADGRPWPVCMTWTIED